MFVINNPWSRDRLCHETIAPSTDSQTCNYDTECSNHHPLSTLRPKGLSHSTIKWRAIYIQLELQIWLPVEGSKNCFMALSISAPRIGNYIHLLVNLEISVCVCVCVCVCVWKWTVVSILVWFIGYHKMKYG